jgi:hypothetical protein
VGSRRDCTWILGLSGFRVESIAGEDAATSRLRVRIERRGRRYPCSGCGRRTSRVRSTKEPAEEPPTEKLCGSPSGTEYKNLYTGPYRCRINRSSGSAARAATCGHFLLCLGGWLGSSCGACSRGWIQTTGNRCRRSDLVSVKFEFRSLARIECST